MVPDSPMGSRMNQRQTLTVDDPDVESVTEHELPWQGALGPE